MTFVQTVADLATRPQNIDALQNAGRFSSQPLSSLARSHGTFEAGYAEFYTQIHL